MNYTPNPAKRCQTRTNAGRANLTQGEIQQKALVPEQPSAHRLARAAHITPMGDKVGAKLFARHLSLGNALDIDAPIHRNRALPRYPLIDRCRSHLEQFSQPTLASDDLAGFSDGTHGAHRKAMLTVSSSHDNRSGI